MTRTGAPPSNSALTATDNALQALLEHLSMANDKIHKHYTTPHEVPFIINVAVDLAEV